jgi:hypothetical protein
LQEWRWEAIRPPELTEETAMDQIKPVADLSQETSQEQQDAARTEVRTLSEVELALAGGGDGWMNW